MKRCEECGWRWCVCIPACASVDWFSDEPSAPVYGPWQRGQDSALEILETAADIAELHPHEQLQHYAALASAYPREAFVDALVYAHMMGHRFT